MNARVTLLFMLIFSLPLTGQGQGSWNLRYSGDLIGSVGINPLSPNNVLAVDYDRLIVSYNQGGTWSTLGFPGYAERILVHPVDTLVIFCYYPSLRRSSDHGLTWTNVLPALNFVESIVIDPIHPDNLYAGNPDGDIYRSIDRGIGWELISHADSGLCSLAIRADSTDILYVGTRGAISKSTDGGFSWRVASTTGADEVPRIVIDFSDPLVAYATAWGDISGVWKTTDGGEHWDPTNLTNFGNWYMDIDGNSPGIVYVANWLGNRVFRSTDEGVSWDTLNQGLPASELCTSLNVHPLNGNIIWFGSEKGGVYQWVPEASTVEGMTELPTSYQLEHNYPNPFNPSTTFRYGLSEPGLVTLSVYDMLGQLVKTLVNDFQSEGYHEAIWDGRNESGASVASGIYIYRMSVVPTADETSSPGRGTGRQETLCRPKG